MITEAAVYTPTRYRFSVQEYEQMGTRGILHEDLRVELIDGEILQMSPIGERHLWCVNRFNRRLVLALGERAIVSIQNPVVLSGHDEPQPDVVVLRPSAEEHRGTPLPGDVALMIEVSDSTLAYDRRVKLPLYARAGIAETWIADLQHDVIVQYADPQGGTYQAATTYRRGDVVVCGTLPDLALAVAALLP
ncbi:MAG TPA: Uma2 family endonuclease [Chloroflexota bacterium]|nr:Uma2 family endonuclease [Chloroflexota bacterium]